MTVRSIHLSIDPAAYGDRMEEITKLAVQKIGMQILRGVVMRTPVDTGRARSNWHVSLEAPVLSEIEPYSPGSKLGAEETANAEGAISVGVPVIEKAGAYGVIYISNNLPYITRLETGWSQQAPAGMVRLTLDQVAAQFE